MSAPRSPICEVTHEGDVMIVVMPQRNYLDEDEKRKFDQIIQDELEKHKDSHLVVDLTAVEYLGSIFLSSLITFDKICKERKRKLALHNVASSIYEVFAITKLNKLFKIFGNREQAMQFLA